MMMMMMISVYAGGGGGVSSAGMCGGNASFPAFGLAEGFAVLIIRLILWGGVGYVVWRSRSITRYMCALCTTESGCGVQRSNLVCVCNMCGSPRGFGRCGK